jgi:hypothetical protein
MPPPQKHHHLPSPSLVPSLQPHCDYVAPPPSASLNVHSHPSSSLTANTAQPSAPPCYVGPQSLEGLPLDALQSFTGPGVSNSNLAQIAAAPCSVSQRSLHVPCLPDRPCPRNANLELVWPFSKDACTLFPTMMVYKKCAG